jgi:hypothetical protein
MRVLLILTIMLLTGCRDYEKTYAPDGSKEFRVKCGGPDEDACDIRAGQLCKKGGYQISNHRDSEGNVIVTCNQRRRR